MTDYSSQNKQMAFCAESGAGIKKFPSAEPGTLNRPSTREVKAKRIVLYWKG